METGASSYRRPPNPDSFFRMNFSWNTIEFTSRYPPLMDGSA